MAPSLRHRTTVIDSLRGRQAHDPAQYAGWSDETSSEWTGGFLMRTVEELVSHNSSTARLQLLEKVRLHGSRLRVVKVTETETNQPIPLFRLEIHSLTQLQSDIS